MARQRTHARRRPVVRAAARPRHAHRRSATHARPEQRAQRRAAHDHRSGRRARGGRPRRPLAPRRPIVAVTVLTITPEGQRLLVTAGRERSKVIAGAVRHAVPRRLRRPRPHPRARCATRSPTRPTAGRRRSTTAAWPREPPRRTRPAPTCASTPTTRSTGTRGATRRSPAPAAEDKPILLSVGYSSCHWCHVMAHESFEDPDIAAIMNEPLREREGRPRGAARRRRDLHAGGAGDDRPRRLADDRVPRRPTAARSSAAPTSRRTTARACPASCGSWTRSTTSWRNRRDDVARAGRAARRRDRAEHARDRLDRRRRRRSPPTCSTAPSTALRAQFDPRFGGFGRAPKFPQAMTLDFLLRRARARRRRPTTLEMITDVARRDGRRRHVRPGRRRLPPLLGRRRTGSSPTSRRCSTTRRCSPARTCTAASSPATPRYRRGRRGDDRATCCATCATPTAGSSPPRTPTPRASRASSTSGRSRRSTAVCGDDAPEVIRYFGVTAGGNFDDPHTGYRGNILHVGRPRPRTVPTRSPRRSPRLFARARARACGPGSTTRCCSAGTRCSSARSPRPRPRSTATTGWTRRARTPGSSLASCAATTAGCCVRGRPAARPPPRVRRGLRRAARGAAHAGRGRRRRVARRGARPSPTICIAAVRRRRAAAAFFTTGADAEALIVRPKDFQDNATPSENSLAANGLLRLAALTGDDALRGRAPSRGSRTLAPAARRAPDRVRVPARRARAGSSRRRSRSRSSAPGDPAPRRCAPRCSRRLHPGVGARSRAEPGAGADADPAARRPRRSSTARATAYVCEHFACRAPRHRPRDAPRAARRRARDRASDARDA